jgi:hypothetical protein
MTTPKITRFFSAADKDVDGRVFQREDALRAFARP